jgi:hypothetical protein
MATEAERGTRRLSPRNVSAAATFDPSPGRAVEAAHEPHLNLPAHSKLPQPCLPLDFLLCSDLALQI